MSRSKATSKDYMAKTSKFLDWAVDGNRGMKELGAHAIVFEFKVERILRLIEARRV